MDWDVYLEGVTKRYGRTVAVAGVNLGVRQGELLTLLGPSGCGKTTTLRIIAGLVRPTAGVVFINMQPVQDVPVHRRNIGMVFQNYALFPHLSVAENVAFGLRTRSVSRKVIRREVAEALDMVKLPGLEAAFPAQLSGGQQQRVALARALVIKPAVLLLDEPFGALDKKLREEMQIELKLLQRRVDITTIFVTHDQEEALTISDTIAIMNHGRVEQHGSPLEVYDRPASSFVAEFIGTSNFFHGRVRRTDAQRWEVASVEGPRVVLEDVGGRLEEGSSVAVAVRPERMRIAARGLGPELPNTAVGRVEQIVYRGSVTHYHIRLPGGQVIVAFDQNSEEDAAAGVVRVGDEVVASWDTRSNRLIRNAAAV